MSSTQITIQSTQDFEAALRGDVQKNHQRRQASSIAANLIAAGWKITSASEAATTNSIYICADSPDGKRFISFRVSDHGAMGGTQSRGLRSKGTAIDIAPSTNISTIMMHVERRAMPYTI